MKAKANLILFMPIGENMKKSSLQHFEKGKKNFQDVNLSFDKEDIVGSFQKGKFISNKLDFILLKFII